MIQNTKNRAKAISGKFFSIGFVLLALGLAYQFATPHLFLSTARIGLHRWTAQKAEDQEGEKKLASEECKKLFSNPMLDAVASKLALGATNDARIGTNHLTTAESRRLYLRSKVSAGTPPGSLLIDLTSTGRDATECATLVNAFADAYVSNQTDQITRHHQTTLDAYAKQSVETGEKLRRAREDLEKLYRDVQQERLLDTNQYYEPLAYEALLEKKTQLAADLDSEKRELDRLKSLDEEGLKQSLSSESGNDALSTLLLELSRAKSHLASLGSNSGQVSPELQAAKLRCQEFENKISLQLKVLLRLKSTQLSETQAAIERLGAKLRVATTNTPKPTLLYNQYLQTKNDIALFEQNRSDYNKIRLDSLHAPVEQFALNYNAQVIDYGVPATKPVSPNQKLTTILVAIAAACLLLGLIAFSLGGTRKPFPRTPDESP